MLSARIVCTLTRIFRSSTRAAAANLGVDVTHARSVGLCLHETKSKFDVQKLQQPQQCRLYSSQTVADSNLDSVTYERVCSETLDALCDYFEELTENATELTGSDVAYGDGVLTVNLGQPHGIYVINRQTPNKQIWLSSPTSGPKRFDFLGTRSDAGDSGKWIYKHSGDTLHQLLQLEISKIIKSQAVNFMHLPYCN